MKKIWSMTLIPTVLLTCSCSSPRLSTEEVKESSASTEKSVHILGDDIPAEGYADISSLPESVKYLENELIEKSTLLEDCIVTYYCPCDICNGEWAGYPTKSGRDLIPYTSVAVDPEIIPLGSEVIIDYGDGDIQYYIADDTGKSILGNHIDVAVSDHQEALELGVKRAKVYYIIPEE